MSNTSSAAAAATAGDLLAGRPGSISQAPSRGQRLADVTFRRACYSCAWLMVALVAFIVIEIGVVAVPAIRTLGPGFLVGRVWNPNAGQFGILAEIWGTLYTSILALGIGTLFGVAVAVFLSERFLGSAIFGALRAIGLDRRPFARTLPDQVERLLKELIELLAAIPSVVYGLWGLFVVIPLVRPACDWATAKLGWLPFFSIVTHNLQQAQRVADYTGFLYVDTTQGGRTGYLVEYNRTAQLFDDPQHVHTKQYIRGEFS